MSNSGLVSGLSEASRARLSFVEVSQKDRGKKEEVIMTTGYLRICQLGELQELRSLREGPRAFPRGRKLFSSLVVVWRLVRSSFRSCGLYSGGPGFCPSTRAHSTLSLRNRY